MESATQITFQIIVLIFSVVIHEVSHGYAALMLGDKTAQYAGRLTLNPLRHLEPFGSVILPLLLVFFQSPVMIAWAKPVPFNPYNLRSQKWGPAVVSVAGPASNLALALFFGLLVRIVPSFSNGLSGLFLINFMMIAGFIAFMNLILAFFNLIPLPPLDGSKVLFSVLSYRWRNVQSFLEQYGFFLVIFFVMFFGDILFAVSVFFFRLITGTSIPF